MTKVCFILLQFVTVSFEKNDPLLRANFLLPRHNLFREGGEVKIKIMADFLPRNYTRLPKEYGL